MVTKISVSLPQHGVLCNSQGGRIHGCGGSIRGRGEGEAILCDEV